MPVDFIPTVRASRDNYTLHKNNIPFSSLDEQNVLKGTGYWL
jgi:hypothetical protein